MNRRDTLKAGAITVFGAAFPFSGVQAQNRYAKYAGKTVVFSVPAHPHYDAMMKILPAFTKETGIKVETDKLAMGRMKEKQLLEMAKPSGDFDLGCYVVMWKGEYVAKNLIQPLKPFFDNPALADPAYDMQDIVPIYLENLGLVGGPKGYLAGPGAQLYGLPYGAETSVLAYRRDIFAKHNLQPPETYDDFRKLLRMHQGQGRHRRTGQPWPGRPPGGARLAAAPEPAGRQRVRRAVEGALQRQDRRRGAEIPAGGGGHRPRRHRRLRPGREQHCLPARPGGDVPRLSTSIAGLVNDPAARARIVGNVSWALHPRGVRRASQSGGLGLAIPKNAKNAEAGFLLMQWLTSKAQDKAVTMAGGAPMRNSTLRGRCGAQVPRVHHLHRGAEVQQPRLAAHHPGVGQDQRAGPGRGPERGAHRQEDPRAGTERPGAAGHRHHARGRLQGLMWPTPAAPSALPLKGAPPAARPSRFRGGRLVD
jgi:multiple sugar transport system substrate-binding protein